MNLELAYNNLLKLLTKTVKSTKENDFITIYTDDFDNFISCEDCEYKSGRAFISFIWSTKTNYPFEYDCELQAKNILKHLWAQMNTSQWCKFEGKWKSGEI